METEPVRCFASQGMTWVCEKRNPNGAEEGWAGYIKRKISLSEIGKGVMAEGAIALLTLAALVETVASLVLSLVSAFQFPDLTERLKSSAFTILWGCQSLVTNIVKNDIWTRESKARESFSEKFLSEGDREELGRIAKTIARRDALFDPRAAAYFDLDPDDPNAL